MTDHEVRPLAGAAPQAVAGGYFVANYPPFPFWSSEQLDEARRALATPPAPETPLGLYVHIPFCRKRCHFCYYKVSTDQNAAEVQRYLDAVLAEARLVSQQAFVGGRPLRFVYFGGGTPSYLSTQQVAHLADGLRRAFSWSDVREVTFEAEPGTLSAKKLHAIRDMGVTRLSLGVESFADHVLEANGRAHLASQVHAAHGWARDAGLPQVNIDLIVGMLEQSEDDWNADVEKTLELDPDSVTAYQMEIPFNTTIYRRMKADGRFAAPIADWPTKRRWLERGFARLEERGYALTSAYTAVKDASRVRFTYRDELWHGADMIGLGVASFGHAGDTHYQNLKDIEPYVSAVEAGELPLQRALALSRDEALVREVILQMKLGHLDAVYFERKFGVDVLARFAEPLARHREAGLLTIEDGRVRLTRDALLMVDAMLPTFYRPEHREPHAA
ncbi:MAG: coproporphyrinogen III oxidase family protein [Deltaproteobacteria bacterium]|nr:coproporphyrinogen III oxidase family protein [Deltaproteobacteria bacterium]